MNAVFALGPGRWGGLAGLFFAAGVILIGRHLAARRRPTLEARVVPYLVDTVGFTRLRQREVSDPAVVVAVLGLLVNIAGFYDPLAAFLDGTVEAGFLKQAHRAMAMTDTEPATLLDRMQNYVPAATYKWIEKEQA